jgi:hypothetical protein
MTARRFTEKFGRFRDLEGRDKWMLVRATMWLAMARIMLLAMPFWKLAAKLSREQSATSGSPDPELLQRIAYAVRAAASNVPWRSDCFPASIAAYMLLRHYGHESTIHLGVEGVARDEIAGHAWLTCGDTVVIGGEDLDRYAEIHRLGA